MIVRECLSSDKIIYYYQQENADDTSKIDEILKDYFRLDYDLVDLCREWSRKDANFAQQSQKITGIRLLRQDPVETLFAFICSQNNAIYRIKGMVETLKREFGREVKVNLGEKENGSGVRVFEFPEIASLAEAGVVERLRELKFGYRAKYLHQAAVDLLKHHNIPSTKEFTAFRSKPYPEAIEFLRSITGVGPKVADCVALMSLDQLSAVPIDTHIWRIARERYRWSGLTGKSMTDRVYREIGDKFRGLFGELAGWAHSVLFTVELKPFKGEAKTLKRKK